MVWLHRWCSDKESACIAGDVKDGGLIPGPGRSPREENGKPFQYSCLENSMNRGAQGVAKSWTGLGTKIHKIYRFTAQIRTLFYLGAALFIVIRLDLNLHHFKF